VTRDAITLLHLYPRDMNIYGDHGNVLALRRRLEWHGYPSRVIEYNQGDPFPDEVDLVVGGGGQDSGQNRVEVDLLRQGIRLIDLALGGTPMLLVCGLYQLFGREFRTASGAVIRGIGLLDLETEATPRRIVGNTVVASDEFGDVVGFENHSGRTFLGPSLHPLGRVDPGSGNNGSDRGEGARFENVIGTYLHGPVLPKNPRLADHLLRTAAERRFGEFRPGAIDDRLAGTARRVAARRPR
jgi:CobQ-like glutamine amidotransferase family enzyme